MYRKRLGHTRRFIGSLLLLLSSAAAIADPLPPQLRGSWKITRILPTTNQPCWTKEQAGALVGSTLIYGQKEMRWKGGAVPLLGILNRTVTEQDFRTEDPDNLSPSFAQLDIHDLTVMEVDLQHEDADITDATTEVPGDTVLLAGPDRIIVSACRVYMEAHRLREAPARPHR